jgi:hypothetical protein
VENVGEEGSAVDRATLLKESGEWNESLVTDASSCCCRREVRLVGATGEKADTWCTPTVALKSAALKKGAMDVNFILCLLYQCGE